MKTPWITIPAAALMIIIAGHLLTVEAPADEAPTNEELAQKTGCIVCHSVDKLGIGPSYREIAKKYKSDATARAALIKSVTYGSKGRWPAGSGGGPMPPYSHGLSAADIARLVDWVLGL